MEEENNEQNEELDTMKSIKEMVETELKEILNIGIQQDNVDNIGKLVDIHKDIENEEYWKKKKEVYEMSYGYGNYNDGGYGYGPEGGNMGNYGRRGVPGTGRGRSRRYRGPEDKMQEMMEHFGNYSEASEAASMGNYGAEEDSIKSLDKMMKCVCMFVDMLEEGAGSQEEAQIIRKYKKKMAE